MSLKKCFIKVIDLLTIETWKQFNSRKKREYSFDFDISRKFVKSFKSDQHKFRFGKKKRLETIETVKQKTESKEKPSSKTHESEIWNRNNEIEFRKSKLLTQSSWNNNFKDLITSGKATYNWIHVTLLLFSQSNMLNLLRQKKRGDKMSLLKNE